MKAAVYYGAGSIRIEHRPDPTAGAGEIVVAMRACGLCGSDLMQWYQDRRAPVVLGHEPVGEVVQVGDGAAFAIGQRVFVHHHVPCFDCDLCRADRHTLCERFRATAIDPGGLAEYIRVPAENATHDVLVLPDHVDDVAGTLIEPVACIIRGQRLAGVARGSHVAVVGAGSMGLLEIQVARALGAGAIVAVEPDADRAARAAACGARVTDGLDAAAVERTFGGRLADQVFVCTHAPSAIAESIHMAGPAGVVQLFAVPEPGHTVAIDFGAIFFREVSIQSTYSAGPNDTRAALEMIADGHIDPESVITHRVGLGDAARAYELAATGQAIKVVVLAEG
jgi:L-iditol 2-dehydrogenase